MDSRISINVEGDKKYATLTGVSVYINTNMPTYKKDQMHQDDSQVGTKTNVYTHQCGTFIEAQAMLKHCKNPTMRTHLKM